MGLVIFFEDWGDCPKSDPQFADKAWFPRISSGSPDFVHLDFEFNMRKYNSENFEIHTQFLFWDSGVLVPLKGSDYLFLKTRNWKTSRFSHSPPFYLYHIWVVLPRTGKMSNICHNFFFWSFTVAKRFDFLKFRQLFWRDFVR